MAIEVVLPRLNSYETDLNDLGLKTAYSIVPARMAAANAGLRRIGKNNFFYSKKYGSWVFIDTWVTDTEMEYDEPTRSLNCPEDCSKCIDSCPTGALNKPFSMNRTLFNLFWGNQNLD